MKQFKFLKKNEDDGIIGAYYLEDLAVQLTDRNNGRVFTFPYLFLRSMKSNAWHLHFYPLGPGEDNRIEYQGLFSYQITGVQEIEDRQLRFWATIWFRTHAGNLSYHITETIPL